MQSAAYGINFPKSSSKHTPFSLGISSSSEHRIQSLTKRAAFFTEDFQKDRLAVRKVFRLFMTTPNKQEAELFGSLPFSDDILEGNAQPLAPLLTERELRSHHLLPRLFFLAGLSKGQPRESAWLEGSAARSGTKAQRHSRQYALYQKVRYFRKERKERRKQNGRS